MGFHSVLELVGLLVPVLSTVASFFNGSVRSKQAAGEAISPLAAKAGAVLNVGALNIDKAIQLMQLVKSALPEQREDLAAPKKEE